MILTVRQTTRVNCASARYRDHQSVTCVDRRHGGNPSIGICSICAHRKPINPADRPITKPGLHRNVEHSQKTNANRGDWSKLFAWCGNADLATAPQWIRKFSESLSLETRRKQFRQMLADDAPENHCNSNEELCRYCWSLRDKVTKSHGYHGKPSIEYEQAALQWNWPGVLREADREKSTDSPFGSIHVISLISTPQRLEDFWQRWPRDWPWQKPLVFEAIDGKTIPAPPNWNWKGAGTGAIGCRASWMSLVSSLKDDKPVLCMEDDCEFLSGAVSVIADVMSRLPDDWQMCYFGGQHDAVPSPFSPGIVRCNQTGRTHCLAIHPRYFRGFVEDASMMAYHIDHQFRRIAKQRKYYAAEPFVAIQGENFSTLRNRQEPARAFHSKIKLADQPIKAERFSHRGDVGDILAALPALRAASASFGGGILTVSPAKFTRQKMSPEIVGSFAPLLEAQPYIKAVRFSQERDGLELDAWRRHKHPKVYSLADRTLDLVRAPHSQRNIPWLAVETRPMAKIIFARSARYRNRFFPWQRIVDKYRDQAAFVGLREEYDEFVSSWGKVPWIQTDDFLELAQVIAGAELVVVNQTSAFWVAEGLGQRIIQEQEPGGNSWNCHHDRPGLTCVLNGVVVLPDL